MAERAKQRAQMQKLKASRMLSGSGSGKGTSMPRVPRQDGSDFPSVVLALPARNILPEMQLPPRKRTLYRLCENPVLEEEEEAADEGPANPAPAPKQEEAGETKGGDCSQNNSVQCVLNQESPIPSLNFESLSIQENAEEPPPVQQGGEEERKPGQPKNKEPKSPRGESSGGS